MSDEPTTPFGWRHFRFEVPESWEPGKLTGSDSEGYARLDDPAMPRLELKWERPTRKVDIQESAEDYVKQMKRAAERSDEAFRREPRLFQLSGSWPEGMQGRAIQWSGSVDCVAVFLLCECGRLTAIQVFFPAGEMRLDVVRRILATFRDHAGDNEPVLWSLYKMRVTVPGVWRLQGHDFSAGFAELRFAGPRRLLGRFRRAGPAEIILKDMDVASWYLKSLGKYVRAEAEDLAHAEVRGDEVVALERNGGGLLAPLWRRAKSDLKLRAMALDGAGWHCPRSNRLWAANVFARDLDEARAADWRVDCH